MADDNENIQGMDAAQAQLSVLEAIATAGIGISYAFSGGRDDGKSNEDILNYLAEGNTRSANIKRRDIRSSPADAEKMGELFIEQVDKQLERVGKTTKSGKEVTKEQAARAGAAAGLMAAAIYYQGLLSDRLEGQVDNAGNSLELVDEDYAEQRFREYGVSKDTVGYRTGQLITAILTGQYKLFLDTEKVQEMLSLIDR